MRYFKYSGSWEDIESLKAQYVVLSEKVRRKHRRMTLLDKLATIIFFLVFGAVFVGLLCLIRWAMPLEEGLFGQILNITGTLALALIALLLSAVIGAAAAAPLWNRHTKAEKALKQQLLHDASGQLREFYGFREPFLVTKCYQSSDRQFDRHDVCIFTVDGELRITANLHYGFFDPKRDLGCYGLIRQEISLRDAQYKDRAAVELRAGELSFLLGCRAKAFIEKQFFRE